MRELAGYVGSCLLAACSLPLLVRTVQDGHARGVSLPFLLLWWFGEVLMLEHVRRSPARTVPLMLNYAANVAIVGVILLFRVLFP
jgi:hypothetical protein